MSYNLKDNLWKRQVIPILKTAILKIARLCIFMLNKGKYASF